MLNIGIIKNMRLLINGTTPRCLMAIVDKKKILKIAQYTVQIAAQR